MKRYWIIGSLVSGFAAVGLIVFLSIARQTTPSSNASTDDQENPKIRPIKFDGTTWILKGPTRNTLSYVIRNADAWEAFSSDRPNHRLFCLTAQSEGSADPWNTYTAVQKWVDGKWVDDGLKSEVFNDGTMRSAEFVLGKMHGLARTFYANEKLRSEAEYVNDLPNGRARAWYENGQLQYDLIKKDGNDVSGKVWDENGKLIAN